MTTDVDLSHVDLSDAELAGIKQADRAKTDMASGPQGFERHDRRRVRGQARPAKGRPPRGSPGPGSEVATVGPAPVSSYKPPLAHDDEVGWRNGGLRWGHGSHAQRPEASAC